MARTLPDRLRNSILNSIVLVNCLSESLGSVAVNCAFRRQLTLGISKFSVEFSLEVPNTFWGDEARALPNM